MPSTRRCTGIGRQRLFSCAIAASSFLKSACSLTTQRGSANQTRKSVPLREQTCSTCNVQIRQSIHLLASFSVNNGKSLLLFPLLLLFHWLCRFQCRMSGLFDVLEQFRARLKALFAFVACGHDPLWSRLLLRFRLLLFNVSLFILLLAIRLAVVPYGCTVCLRCRW